MKLSYLVLALSLVGVGSVGSAANFSSLGCTKKWYDDFGGLIQKVSLFPEDNRGPLAVRGPEEGLSAHDIQRAEENIGVIYCPSHTPGKFFRTGASFIGSNDQLVTNIHAFVDDDGSVADPLSKCVFRQVALSDGRGVVDHPLNLKDGAEGLKQLKAMGALKYGTFPADFTDDYAVVKLTKPILSVKPYQLSRIPIELHGCKEGELCQRIISISPLQHQMKIKVKSSDLILQTSDLRGVIYEHNGHESTLFSNTSATVGASGTLQFLRNDDGKLLRSPDGDLIPISILARAKDQSFDGKAYSSKDKIYSLSVGLDGKVSADIQIMSGKTQTAEVPDDSSLPVNNEGN